MSKRNALPQVISSVQKLEAELQVAEARELTPEQRAAATAVRASLEEARKAADGTSLRRGRFRNWWQGTQIESAYLHLHAARVEIIDVYDGDDLAAEIPRAVARVQSGLHRDDPRRLGTDSFTDKDPRATRPLLRRLVEDGYESSDLQHERLRSFRNITLLAAAAVFVFTLATVIIVSLRPDLLPLCFREPGPDGILNTKDDIIACPSGDHASGPSGQDILIVALLGLLGGVLSAVFSLRNLRGTSAAYDAPVALAILKSPLGALTAIVGLVLVHGEFIPGLSALDSQNQILAYALLFGVAQQAFTRLVDQKAQSILEGLPSKDPESSPGQPVPPAPPTGAAPPSASEVPAVGDDPGELDQTPPDDLRPNPEGDDGDQVQDDDATDVMPDSPEGDHT